MVCYAYILPPAYNPPGAFCNAEHVGPDSDMAVNQFGVLQLMTKCDDISTTAGDNSAPPPHTLPCLMYSRGGTLLVVHAD